MEPFRLHLYVCTQQKPEGVPSCPTAGAWGVVAAIDREVRARGLDNDVQITTSGCLGLCDEGPLMVVYPEGTWYRKVQAKDAAEIVEQHLRGGKPVERLVWNDAAAMKSMSTDHRDDFRAMMAAKEKSGMLPDRIEEMIRGFMASRILLTALELDLFTAVEDGATTQVLAKRMHASERGLEPLLHALVSLGLLVKAGERFQNTEETSRFFVQGAPDNHRNGLLHSANMWHSWSTLTDVVRKGAPVERESRRDWTPPFIAGMDRIAKYRAPVVAKAVGADKVKRLLDLGGGSGAYSIAFAKSNPQLQAEILDIPAVVALTGEYVESAGASGQVTVRTGDMLTDDYGTGFDLVMLNAICHMFSPEQNVRIVTKALAALAPGGRLIVQDFLLDPGKTSPQFAALFSINMLVATEEGASYTEEEYRAWLQAAGFRQIARINLPGPSDLMVAAKA